MRSMLRVSIVQIALVWQSPEDNRQHIETSIASLRGETDLIVLPEMFTTGFMMSPETMAETMDGPTVHWLKTQAHRLNTAICGSIAMKVEDGYCNRFLFVTAEGDVSFYDKRHLFRMGNEHEHFIAGSQRTIINYRGWRILPSICYDLRFPVFLRNRNDYDVMINVANWPQVRRQPWRTLLQARAIENTAYVIGVNRVGRDESGLTYSGDSLVVDYKGELLCDLPDNNEVIETAILHRDMLHQFCTKFPVWQDADAFEIALN